MSIQELVVYPRETTGKAEAGRLRKRGLAPSVVYGLEGGSVSISVEPKIVNKIIHSERGLNTVFNLRLENSEQSRYVMIKSIDRHPVSDRLLHVDFLRVDMDTKITTMIPIEIIGTPEGTKMGGILTIVRHDVEVECLPKDLPGVLRVDASSLGMDESLRIGDLPQIEGVEYKLAPNRVIAVVQPPEKEKTEEVEEEEVAEDLAEVTDEE